MDSIIVFCASYLFVLVIVGLAYAWFKTNKELKVQFIVATVVAGVLALIASRIAKHLYYDPRPFVSEHVKPLISHAPDNGFPSDHALLTMTLTAITYFYNKKVALGMLGVTIIVGIARVLAKVHSPLDIAAGWILGATGAVAAYYIVTYFWTKHKQPTKVTEPQA